MNTGEHAKTSRCLRCGRTLRSARSVSRGYGAWCRAKIRAAAIAEVVKGFKDAQIEKARELITDGGLVPLRAGIFRSVSSDGERSYLTAGTGQCNCAGGLRGRYRCFHGLAAMIVTASKGA